MVKDWDKKRRDNQRAAMDLLEARGDFGATIQDVAQHIGMHSQWVASQLSELRRQGLVKRVEYGRHVMYFATAKPHVAKE